MDSIKKLTDLFSAFPTIGKRTAGRFVFYLLKLPKEKIEELASAILELKNNVKLCSFCFNPHELVGELCQVCQDSGRNKKLLCLVEKEADLISIENTKRYKGLYFILGGLSSFTKSDIDNLRIAELKERIANPQKFSLPAMPAHAGQAGFENFTEIIIATNPTPEGKSISILAERALKEISSPGLKITHLAKGLPVGGELEYADEETLESAFEGRK
ncbi:MAG: toprim domain-containing protein [Patescibacteria group bacterium]